MSARAGLSIVSLLSIALAGGLPARAAFPGSNGLIVLAPERGSAHVLITAEPDGTSARQLTGGRINALEPTWSPDGKEIAFGRPGKRGGIYVIAADGSSVRRVTIGGSQPAWSPDGSRLLFVRPDRRTARTAVFVVDADGSGERRLPCPVSPQGPEWSPDGRQIAFSAPVPGHPASFGTAIFLASASGTACHAITDGGRGIFYSNPSWSPDSTKIALTISEASDVPAVGVAVVDRKGGLIYSLHLPGVRGASLQWAPDGTKLLLLAGESGAAFLNPDLSGFTPAPALGKLTYYSAGSDWQPIRRG